MLNQDKGTKISRIFDYLHEHIIAIIIIVAVLAGSVCMAIILHDNSNPQETDSEITEYQSMKTVYFAMDKVSSLNPLSSKAEDTHYLSKLVFSSLFRLNSNLNIEKDLVDTYEVNTSEGSVTIKLKDNVEFTDGSDLTAYDVRYTVDQIDYLGDKSPYYGYISKIDYIEVEGDTELTVYFKSPADAALDNLTFPIVSSYSYDSGDSKPIGSGQYSYGSYANKKLLKLKVNKGYYGKVATNALQFKVISDKSKIPGLMTIDSITAAVVTSNDVAIDAEDKGLQVTPIPSNEVEYIGFNFKNQYLKDVRVRQAIAKAINCQNLIHDSYGGAGMVNDSIYYPGFLGSENAGDPYEQDQIGAAELLQSCGYKDSDENGFLENKKGKELELSILVNENNDSRVDAAQTIADEMNKIGINTTVDVKSWKSYKKALKKKKFDIYVGGYQFDQKYNLKEMFAKKNNLSYSNQDVLKYVKQLETALTAKQQKEVYGKLKPILTEEIPYYCICYKTYNFISVERFNAETIPTFFNRYRGAGFWQWERILTKEVEEETDN